MTCWSEGLVGSSGWLKQLAHLLDDAVGLTHASVRPWRPASDLRKINRLRLLFFFFNSRTERTFFNYLLRIMICWSVGLVGSAGGLQRLAHLLVNLVGLSHASFRSVRPVFFPASRYTQPEKERLEGRGQICFDKLIFTKPFLSRNLYEMLRDCRIVSSEPVQAPT